MVIDVSLQDQLATQSLQLTGRLVAASNATFQGKIGNDIVVYKPIAGEQPLWDFPDGNLASREYASYIVSKKLGLGIVPETVLADGPLGVGMIQRWVDVDETVDRYKFATEESERLRNIALFDAVINNGDRKFGHLLPKRTGQILGCDHGVTFHQENRLRTVLWQWRGCAFTDDEFQILEKAKDVASSHELVDLLSSAELDALEERVEVLAQNGSFPQPTDDWPPVPWPTY